MKRGTETEFELATIERLMTLGYQHAPGPDLDRPGDEVVLRDSLVAHLKNKYPDLPDATVKEVVSRAARPDGVDTIRRNLAFHLLLTGGVEVRIESDDGRVEHRHIYLVDWENPEANDFKVVNQLSISGANDRRPDILIYVNGLPLVVFELKNPYSEVTTADDAYNQIRHYVHDIPQLFEFNAIAVVSDGIETLHGMWDSGREWFLPWKSIDGLEVEPGTTGSMKALVEGLFPKDRLLSYVRNFVLFEVANDKIMKKGAKYHQFFAVRLAVERTLDAFRSEADRRIGVIWHTTGSGKSLSMTFLVGILRNLPELENPTFVVQVDRADLDDQLHDQFVAARSLVGDVKQADSADELRSLLQTEGGEVVFTTIEKFRLKRGKETKHPVLSERSNVIVIADEAHRSQYGMAEGFAGYLKRALPKAKLIGFTGTPVYFSGANTTVVFGDLIHTYDIRQSQEDGATLPLYYEPRLARLHLSSVDLDEALKEIEKEASEQDRVDLERRKGRWAALAAAAGAKKRVREVAADVLEHYQRRTATLEGKAMIVCMNRVNCVRMYDALTSLPGCPEVKVVMTSNLAKDPSEWSEAGHTTTKAKRETIKQRMVDPDDPLKIVIVCDMWLTGTDIPCLHTLYIDKPMRGHSMIQAISRVNRVFRDKPQGLLVDYIGIGDELREATAGYTKGGGKGDPAPDIEETARPMFLGCLEDVRQRLPTGHPYGDWRELSRIDLEDLYALVWGDLMDDEKRRDEFLQAEHRLSSAFLLVKHLDDCDKYTDEVIFCQRVRKQIIKTLPGRGTKREIEHAIRDLVDDNIESEGVVDIFSAAGIGRADVSILDDGFLQTFKDRPHENLRLKLLERLLNDEIQKRRKKNPAKGKSFQAMLAATLEKYHNRVIDAAVVVREMIAIRQELERDHERAKQLGLEDDELAFYDAIAENYETVYEQPVLRDLVHEVVQVIKKNLKVDWTEPHRDDIQAAIRAAVRRTLRRNDVRREDFDPFIEQFFAQAETLYADWPLAA